MIRLTNNGDYRSQSHVSYEATGVASQPAVEARAKKHFELDQINEFVDEYRLMDTNLPSEVAALLAAFFDQTINGETFLLRLVNVVVKPEYARHFLTILSEKHPGLKFAKMFIEPLISKMNKKEEVDA